MERTNARTLTAGDAPGAGRPRRHRRVVHLARQGARPRRDDARARVPTSSRSSSRSSRPARAGPTAASSATRRSIARSSNVSRTTLRRWGSGRVTSSPRRSRARGQPRVPRVPRTRPGLRGHRRERIATEVDRRVTVRRIGFAYNPTIERHRRASGSRLRLVPPSRCRRMAGTGRRHSRRCCAELRTTDALVVLGGDGTFLRAARAVAEVDVPLLGINLGKVGFLSKAEASDLEPVLERIAAGELPDRRAHGDRGPDPAGGARGPTRRAMWRSTTSSSRAVRSPGSAAST